MFSKNTRGFMGFGPSVVAGTVAAWLSFGCAPGACAQSMQQAQAGERPAPEAPSRERPSAPTETRWYGYQPAIADAAAISSMVVAVASLCPLYYGDDPPDCSDAKANLFGYTAIALYFAASPAIHVAHGHWDKAGLSLGVRTAPILLALALDSGRDRGSSTPEAFTVLGGVAAAMLIDDAFIARDKVQAESTSWYVTPTLDPRQRTASISVGGLF